MKLYIVASDLDTHDYSWIEGVFDNKEDAMKLIDYLLDTTDYDARLYETILNKAGVKEV